MTLQNKVVLITGAAGGIGRAMAKRFVAEGSRVAIADLNVQQAHATASELGGKRWPLPWMSPMKFRSTQVLQQLWRSGALLMF